VTKRDVFNVDEHFVFALLVPHLVARVARVPANCIEQGDIPPALVRLAGNVRAWRVAEANAIIAAARGERILSKPRRPISETNFSLLAWEARTAQQMWARASKRPSAGGNIGGRRRAEPLVQDFGLYG
jgi:hypothetical protein